MKTGILLLVSCLFLMSAASLFYFLDQRSAYLSRVTDSEEYGSIRFLKQSSIGSKYFNIYPLKDGKVLPCRHEVFKLDDRIEKNVQLRKSGNIPAYVELRKIANLNNPASKDFDPNTTPEVNPNQSGPIALGSGFVLGKELVITNHHLVEKANAEALFIDEKYDLAAFGTTFEINSKHLDTVQIFGSYQISSMSTLESLGKEVVIEGFQMHEILRIEGPLEMIDDENVGILLNPIKGSVYWGVVSGLSGSPVVDKTTGKVLGVARSAGFYTNEDFPEEDESNTYIRIIDVDQLRDFISRKK